MAYARFFVASLLILGLCSACAVAGVPPMISYQGKLTQLSGAPVLDGTYSMVFTIYDDPVLSTPPHPLWSETNPDVQVKGGLFSVLLGSVINLPPNLFDNPDRWLAVKVASDTEVTPRQKIASSAFAFRAAVAGTVDDGATTTIKIADGAVTTDKLAAGAVTYSKLPSGTVLNRWQIPWFGIAGDATFQTMSMSYVGFGRVLTNADINFDGNIGAPPAGLSRRLKLLIMAMNSGVLSGPVGYVRVVGDSGAGAVITEYGMSIRGDDDTRTSLMISPGFTEDDTTLRWQLQARSALPGKTIWIHEVQLIVEDYVP